MQHIFRVLVIADEHVVNTLSAEPSIKVVPIETAEAALERLAQEAFDAVLVKLNDFDWEAIKMLRQNVPTVPIIAVISSAEQTKREEFAKTLQHSVKLAVDRQEEREAEHKERVAINRDYATLRQCLSEAKVDQAELKQLASSGVSPAPRRAPETVRVPEPTVLAEGECAPCTVRSVCRECGVTPEVAKEFIALELKRRKREGVRG